MTFANSSVILPPYITCLGFAQGAVLKKVLPFAIGIISILLPLACQSSQTLRIISENEIPKHTQVISDFQSGNHLGQWVQPINKTDKCEILYESYPLEKNRQTLMSHSKSRPIKLDCRFMSII